MITKVTTLIPLFFTSCLTQIAMDFGTRADMTFGEDNDRYNVDAIIHDQSSMDMANQFAWRRFIRRQNQKDQFGDDNQANDNKVTENNKNKDIDIGTGLLDALKETVDQMADDNGIGYHDNMKPVPNGEVLNDEDYEKNIQKFAGKGQTLLDKIVILHGGEKSGRRSIVNPEQEILFHYGVPVKMKINGFLKVPLSMI